jgi:small subunit ribosomal protein S17
VKEEETTDQQQDETPAEQGSEEPVAEEPVAEEPVAEESAPAAETVAATPAPAAAPGAGDTEEEPLGPKQRRKLARSRFAGEAKPQRSPEERSHERADARKRGAADRARWRTKQAAKAGAKPAAEQPDSQAREDASAARKVRRGLVVSAKPDKTITVRIDVIHTHRRYGKVIRNTTTLHAHDERNQAGEGDVVRVVECRPLSRTKRWRLLEVVEKAR